MTVELTVEEKTAIIEQHLKNIAYSEYNAILSLAEAQAVAEPVEKHGTFTVVSEYKGCDLVQWQYNMLSEYKYFLHCPK